MDSISTSGPPAREPPATARLGLAVASLVLGVLALVLSFVLIGLVLGLIGLVLGLIHVARKRGTNGMAWWGISLALAGIVASVGFGVAYYQFVKRVQEQIASSGDGESLSGWEGVLAPDISVTTLDGKSIKLSELKGKRVVLDFWATWCGPCVREIPSFIRLYQETSRDNLLIVGISEENASTLKEFVKQKGVNYPIASASDLPAPYKDVRSIPTTFFIDRKGVIQSVLVGTHEFDELRRLASAGDFDGQVKPAPAPPPSGLKESDHPLKPVQAWSKELRGAGALCEGDWDGDGVADILVEDGARTLHVLGKDGVEKDSLRLPGVFSMIECGHDARQGARLLGYSNWENEVMVLDRTGKKLWSYAARSGVDGAHWGDLDGDGTDEMVVGMNGFGGLHAVADPGRERWRVSSLGNVWNQAVIPATTNRPALVFATEAGGSVRIFDAKGIPVRAFRPAGKYCTQMTAAVINQSGSVQGIAIGDGDAIAFDADGRVAWTTPAIKNAGAWRGPTFACGDIDGDGTAEWVFCERDGALVVATATGEKLASIPGQSGDSSFVILPGRPGRALLVTLHSGTLLAYSFE